MEHLSTVYRLKALDAERRVREATSSQLRLEWGQIALEWHNLANTAARRSSEDIEWSSPKREEAGD